MDTVVFVVAQPRYFFEQFFMKPNLRSKWEERILGHNRISTVLRFGSKSYEYSWTIDLLLTRGELEDTWSRALGWGPGT